MEGGQTGVAGVSAETEQCKGIGCAMQQSLRVGEATVQESKLNNREDVVNSSTFLLQIIQYTVKKAKYS